MSSRVNDSGKPRRFWAWGFRVEGLDFGFEALRYAFRIYGSVLDCGKPETLHP